MTLHGWARRVGTLALAAFACSAALLTAADGESMIKTPQKARIQFANGRIFTGTLVSVSDKEVEFQFANAARAVKYKVADIKAIQTADDVFLYNAEKGRFESRKAKPGKDDSADTKKDNNPAETNKDKARAGSGKMSADLQFVVLQVEVEKPEMATAEGLRAAVQKVVQTLLDGRTVAKEEKVISEKVLSAAAELVKGGRELSRTKQGEKWSIRLAAAVDRGAVAARLKDAGLKVKNGPRGVGTDLPPDEEIKAHAAEVLQDVLADLSLTIVGEARVKDWGAEGEDSGVQINVRAFADADAYRQVLKRLQKVLEIIKVSKTSLSVKVAKHPADARRLLSAEGALVPKGLAGQGGSWALWAMSEADPAANDVQWEVFLMPESARRAMSALEGRLYFLVAVAVGGQVAGWKIRPLEPELDRPPTTIWHKWGWNNETFAGSAGSNWICAPIAFSSDRLRQARQLDFRLDLERQILIEVPRQDLQRVSGVYCTILMLPK
jgi:hypothetical protein